MRSTRPLRLCACRWHRVAVSVDGGMVTLVADCEPQLPILAQGPRFISTAGLTVLGTQDLGEETFEVAFQGLGFPHSSVGKKSACNAGDPGLIPGSGRSAGEGIGYSPQYSWAFPVTQLVKNQPAMWEIWVRSLGGEDPLEKGKATQSSILAWRILWTV